MRWLRRSEGLEAVSVEAGDLLALRLAARRRISLGCVAVMTVPLLVLFVVLGRSGPSAAEPAPGWGIQVGWLATFALCSVVVVAGQLLELAADRRIAAGLPRLVERDRVAPVTVVLAPGRLLLVGFAQLVAAGFVVVVWLYEPAWLAAADTGGFVLIAASAAWSLVRVLRRETVAVDGFSLAIDERLRSEDASKCASFALVSVVMMPSLLPHLDGVDRPHRIPDALFLGLMAALLVTLALSVVGFIQPAWRGRRAARWTAQIRQVRG